MKKPTLQEELQRIHEITYGKSMVNENFIDDLLGKIGLGKKDEKKIDDPKKADLVSPDVAEFYKTLEDTAAQGGLSEQPRGSMEYQKGVETMQIGLILLGYELPKFGVDGLFGPETASAVRKFKSDNSVIKESADSLRDKLDDLGYTEKGNELTSGGSINDKLTDIVSQILDKYSQSNPDVEVTITAGNDKFHHNLNYVSQHTKGNAIDLVLNPYNSKNASDFIKLLNSTKSSDGNFSYIDEYTNPTKAATGGHFHLQYGGKSSSSSGTSENATPEMLNKLLELLKAKGVKSEELKQYLDQAAKNSQINVDGLTDINFYKKLLENLGAPESEENLKFLYAWRQSEGSGGKYNPFNTTWDLPGSTNANSVGVKNYKSLEDGMKATIKTLRNGLYTCIVDGLVNDIGAAEIAKCESLKTWGTGTLVAKVVDGYERGASPKIKSLA
jgi:hypothetical protein